MNILYQIFGDIYIDIYNAFTTMEITPMSATAKMLFSFCLGGIIGIERQTRRQSAGMRTITLICIASTAAMLLSIWIPQNLMHNSSGDPARLAAQVITGIGFLGAGAIIQSHGSVRGLTTAACVWVVSIIGLCVGAGLYAPALILTFFTLFVLIALERVEKRSMLSGEVKMLHINFDTDSPDIDHIIKIVKSNSLYIYDFSVDKKFKLNTSTLTLKLQVSPRNTLSNLFDELKKIEHVDSVSLTVV